MSLTREEQARRDRAISHAQQIVDELEDALAEAGADDERRQLNVIRSSLARKLGAGLSTSSQWMSPYEYEPDGMYETAEPAT